MERSRKDFSQGSGGSERNLYNMGFETELFDQAKIKLTLGYGTRPNAGIVTHQFIGNQHRRDGQAFRYAHGVL